MLTVCQKYHHHPNWHIWRKFIPRMIKLPPITIHFQPHWVLSCCNQGSLNLRGKVSPNIEHSSTTLTCSLFYTQWNMIPPSLRNHACCLISQHLTSRDFSWSKHVHLVENCKIVMNMSWTCNERDQIPNVMHLQSDIRTMKFHLYAQLYNEIIKFNFSLY